MDSNTNLDIKYRNLAADYSKLRANVSVLKKAVLDEQASSRELKDCLKEHEQRLRKSNQEMESLTFRNQQLTKRISVLQEELEIKTVTGKRFRGKSSDTNTTMFSTNVTLLDEELQKKIIDNAQLISTMTDKDLEITNLHEIVTELEDKLLEIQQKKKEDDQRHSMQMSELQIQQAQQLKHTESRLTSVANSGYIIKQNGDIHSDDRSSVLSIDDINETTLNAAKLQNLQLQNEVEHWKTEYELFFSKHTTDTCEEELDSEQRTKEYFYQRIDKLMTDKQMIESESGSLAAECNAYQVRLELSLEEKAEMENKLEDSMDKLTQLQEELNTTSHNYEQQLSTMSEHLADLNDKYTEQCELIQQLQFQIQAFSKNSKRNAK